MDRPVVETFHPELRWAARFLPRSPVGPRLLRAIRRLTPKEKPPVSDDRVTASLEQVPGGQTARVFRPRAATASTGAMLWIHGGGFVLGSPAQDDFVSRTFARELGICVVAPSYRLAPEHPFPAPIEDAYAALKWLHGNARALGVRADRIVVGGASAGGGLAAGVCLMARDRGEVPVAFQLLVYPMLDDRTVGRAADARHRNHRLWNAESNHFGWSAYLGREPSGPDVSPYAAPARATSLEGLPPTWIGVGTCDLFHDEDLEYARRLETAGVRTELHVIPGVFHGFDVFRRANVVTDFRQRQLDAIRRALP